MTYADPAKARAYAKAYGAGWLRRQYHARKAAGVCVWCRTPSPKFAHCLECRKKKQRYYHEHEKPLIVAKANRQCACGVWCVRAGAVRCQTCSAKHANAMRWRKDAA